MTDSQPSPKFEVHEVALVATAADGRAVAHVWLYTLAQDANSLRLLDANDAANAAQEAVQLVEDGRYDYEVDPPHLRLGSTGGTDIVVPCSNPRLAHCGVISPRAFVGRLRLLVMDVVGKIIGETAVEVRSRKLDYDTDFRRMLDDIGEWCLDLALDIASPTEGSLTPKPASTLTGLYQQFAFVRALVGGRCFATALQAIQSRPHTRIASRDASHSIQRPFRARSAVLKAIARATRRAALPAAHPLSRRVPSVATHVSAAERYITADTAENQFVRFAVERFDRFLVDVESRAATLNDSAQKRLLAEIAPLRARLRSALAMEPLVGVGALASVPFASTVLQSRDGYREIFRAYLLFGVSAQFSWQPSDDTYWVSQRDAATLYEYWAFLRLLFLVTRVARLGRPDASELIARSGEGFSVMLRRGRGTAVRGVVSTVHGNLALRLSFNRSFRGSTAPGASGSWTIGLRPDYTLSLWPAHLPEENAEATYEMVHVHFDAKYRVEFEDVLHDSELRREISGLGVGAAEPKNADLAKMHAYRDAIRSSYGAYVLYPGDTDRHWPMYRELMPGLGAYTLRPGTENPALEAFLTNLIVEAADRGSERANLARATATLHGRAP